MSNATIVGKFISLADRGSWKTLTIQRDAADDYEREHADKTIIPFDVSSYAAKKLPELREGATVAVAYILRGSLWKERRYLSAAVESVDVISQPDSDPADEPGAAASDPTGAADGGTVEEPESLPF